MNSSYYVYYKVREADSASALAAVTLLQRELADATGIRGRLLRRRDDPSTWMEVYENVTDGDSFEAMLQSLVETRKIPAWLAPGGGRHQEIFQEF